MNHLISSELLSDEHIIWSGQPDPSKIFSSGDFFLIPFSILWGGFAIFWEATVLASGAPGFFALWGVPFVLIGLYFIFGRFIYKAYNKKRTYYFVTNKRIIILKDKNQRKIEAEFIDRIATINKKISTSTGTVIFGSSPGMLGMYANSGMDLFMRGGRYGAIAPAFYDIQEADDVYRLVNEIRNGSYEAYADY